MKILPVIVMISFVIMACQNSGMVAQPEKSSTKEIKGVNMKNQDSASDKAAKLNTCDWKNFKKPDDATLQKILSPLQHKVTQREGTEAPFTNEYNKNNRDGIYVDIVSGEPLFSSKNKYDSGTGWPSFTQPLEQDSITKSPLSLEVKSRHAGSHLGHVFPDGPQPTGLRYCMNSAALRFIPKEDLEKEGYGEYRKLFK